MEANLSLRETLTSVVNKSNLNSFINTKLKQPLFDFDKKFNVDNTGKKVNLTFFGNVSVGKTTLINLFIRHQITQGTNKDYVSLQSAPTPSTTNASSKQDEEEEEELEEKKFDGFIELSTKDIENTYFVCLIENSDSEAYEIILEVNNDQDKIALMKINSLKNKQFDDKNQIIFQFGNDENGIKAMNDFLNKVDYECLNLIKSRRVTDLNKGQQIQQDFIPSKMIIKIPGFPKEYRLIDSPGLSIETFRKAFIKMINDLDYLNFFLIVNDIYAKESYSLTDDIVKEVTNDYGSPIIYSFITKGNKFIKEFPKINANYKAYVRLNYIKFKDLDEMKNKDQIKFRKVFPINDKEYSEDVKNCLGLFFQDLEMITQDFGIADYEASVMLRFRKIICNINDKISKDFLFSPEQLSSLKQSAEKAKSFYDDELRNYFQHFTEDFDRFKNRFPDFHQKLLQVYDNHETRNDCGVIRSNYIKKHTQLSFEDFQKIIFKKPQELVLSAFNQIYEKVDDETKNKILERLKSEGLLDENLEGSNNVNIGALLLSSSLILSGAISLVSFIGMRAAGFIAAEGLAFLVGGIVFPVIGWIAAGVGLIFSSSNVIGLWFRKNTSEDITKGLLKWLSDNKAKILQDSLIKFEELKEKVIAMLTDFKVFENWTNEMIHECDKFKPNSKPFPTTDYKEEFKILLSKRLKNFFTKVFEYVDPSQE